MRFRTPKIKPPFTLIPNHIINTKTLSCKAKAILVYLLSKPENWQVYESDITNHCTDGRDSVRTGIKELIKNGYLIRGKRLRNEAGHLKEYQYEVNVNPLKSSPESKDGFSNVGKSNTNNINSSVKPKKTKKLAKTIEEKHEEFLEYIKSVESPESTTPFIPPKPHTPTINLDQPDSLNDYLHWITDKEASQALQ